MSSRQITHVVGLIALALCCNCDESYSNKFDKIVTRFNDSSHPNVTVFWGNYGGTFGTLVTDYVEETRAGEEAFSQPAEDSAAPHTGRALSASPGGLTASPSGQSAASSILDPATGAVTQTLYIPDFFSGGILVVSAPAVTQIGLILPSNQPDDVVLSPDQSTLYAAITPAAGNGTGSIAVISTAANSITRTIALPVNTYPQFLAVSPDGATLYIADNHGNFAGSGSNYMLAVDLASGTVKARITVSPGFTEGALGRPVVSPDGLSIYQADSAGLEVIDATTLQPNYAIPLLMNNQSHAVFTPDGRFLYAPGYHSISVIDAATSQVAATINLPAGSSSLLGDLAVTPDGTALLAADLTASSGQGALYQIDPETSSIVATIPPPANAPLEPVLMQVVVTQ